MCTSLDFLSDGKLIYEGQSNNLSQISVKACTYSLSTTPKTIPIFIFALHNLLQRMQNVPVIHIGKIKCVAIIFYDLMVNYMKVTELTFTIFQGNGFD